MNDDIFALKGKVAAVTGGGGELGGAMAMALAGRGAAVALLDVREGAAAEAAKKIASAGGKAIGVACDVLDEKSLAATAAKVVAALGRVDILVNAAGGNAPSATTSRETVQRADLDGGGAAAGAATFFDLDPAAFRSVFDLNVLGTFLACRAFGRVMAEGGGGVIVNISSMTASGRLPACLPTPRRRPASPTSPAGSRRTWPRSIYGSTPSPPDSS